jgi:hypothetical protein
MFRRAPHLLDGARRLPRWQPAAARGNHLLDGARRLRCWQPAAARGNRFRRQLKDSA